MRSLRGYRTSAPVNDGRSRAAAVAAAPKRAKRKLKRAAALQYAKAGLAVVPLHGKTKDGRCTCGAADCTQAGAHLRTPRGIADATKDAKTVSQMWTKWPMAKICIALGGPAKLLALVTDSAAAQKTLRDLATPCGALPSTVTIQHEEQWARLFRCARRQTSNVKLAEGVRLLGDGEFVIAPSRVGGRSGKRRFVVGRALGEVPLAQAPAWLFEIGARPGSDIVDAPETTVPQPPAAPGAVIVNASAVAPTGVDWIWPNTIASGRITSLVGYPGHGKSHVAIDIAATISTGRPWPGKVANSAASDVIILSAEDALADTVVPRLIAAGANLDAVRVIKAVRNAERAERRFGLAADLEQLEKAGGLERVRLVIVDPTSAYLAAPTGKSVNRKQVEGVQSVLDRCAGFAERHDLGLLVVAHLNKSTSEHAITRTADSVEWMAVPRAVHLVMSEAGSNRRLFLPLKNNLAPDCNGYAFEIREQVIAGGIRTSAVAWSDDAITIPLDEALAAPARMSGAMKFLREALRNGPQPQRQIEERGGAAGFSPKQLRTAREKLGVQSTKQGVGSSSRWVWRLPEMDAHLGSVVNGDGVKTSASGEGAATDGDARSTTSDGDGDAGTDTAKAGMRTLGNADLSDAAGPSERAATATEGGR